MVISRESDYAIRILRILADGEKHTIGDICETEIIPKQFGYKIVDKLRNGGLIVCERGKYGGCRLDCNLHEVSLYQVLQIVDNDCYLNLCLTPGYKCPWADSHDDKCRVHMKLTTLQEQFDSQLKSINMYSLMFE